MSIQGRGVVALPADVRKRQRLDTPGTQLRVVEREDGVIELHPLTTIPLDQAWFWTDRWRAQEAEANADIVAGRVTEHDSGDDLLDHLDGLRAKR